MITLRAIKNFIHSVPVSLHHIILIHKDALSQTASLFLPFSVNTVTVTNMELPTRWRMFLEV